MINFVASMLGEFTFQNIWTPSEQGLLGVKAGDTNILREFNSPTHKS